MPLPALAALLLTLFAGAAAPLSRNLGPSLAYVGDDACASCHAKQAASFPGTAMGRSFALPSTLLKEGKLRLPPGGVTFTHARSGCRYRVFEEGGVLKQSEIRLDDLGREAFTDTRSIAFVLGSGDRGQTFLVRQGGRLYQSPIAFRKDRDGWGMAAGYDAAEHSHFSRPVTGPCLFCHANRAAYVEGTLNEYRDPPLAGLTIGCERCHGPGALHVKERRTRPPGTNGVDDTIVNPRRLPLDLRDSVCFQCHLQGDARLVKAGRGLYDFRPGLPLSDFFAVLHAERAPAAGAKPGAPSGDEGIEVVSHVERLRASRCWRASGGKITCLTCHDPHRTPHGEEAARQFGAACLTCHKLDDCRLTEMPSGSTPPGIDPHDCVRCHMAKLPPTDAPHTLFTDHLIARRPAQAPPARETPSREDKVLVSFLEKGRGSRRDLGVGYLLFVSRIGESRYGDRGASILEPMLSGLRDDVNAMRMLADYYGRNGREADAVPLLQTLVQRAPQMAEFRVELGRTYRRTGRKADSMALIQAAVEEDPDDAPARLTLGDLLMDAGKPTEAEAQIREAVRLDPALAPAHARLGDLHLKRGDFDRALDSYAAALALAPRLASVRPPRPGAPAARRPEPAGGPGDAPAHRCGKTVVITTTTKRSCERRTE